MKLNGLVTALVLALVLSSASAAQFTFDDIVKAAPPKKGFEKRLRRAIAEGRTANPKAGDAQGSGSGAGAGKGTAFGITAPLQVAPTPPPLPSPTPSDIREEQFLVIAQAKEAGTQQAHPSAPEVTVDVEVKIPGCKPFDWLFSKKCAGSVPRSDVKLPNFTTVKLPRAFLHIFQMPQGWKNARLTLPAFGECQSSRTAPIREARHGDSLCRTAQFHKPSATPEPRCKQVPYRSCTSFWVCETKYRTVCDPSPTPGPDDTECSQTYLVLRLFTATERIPYVVATTGGVYDGFRACSDAEAANYFTK